MLFSAFERESPNGSNYFTSLKVKGEKAYSVLLHDTDSNLFTYYRTD